MIKQHKDFTIPDNIDRVIWRYLSIKKLKSLLELNSLYFARADLLGDEHEGSYSSPTIKRRETFYEGATDHFIQKGLPEMNKNWRLCTYINCWHVNTDESIAMWKLYSKGTKSLVIKSTISSLKKSIQDSEREFLLKPISYVDYEQDYISEANAFSPFFFKQKAYEHEREFRIITDELDKIGQIATGKIQPKKGLFIKIQPNILIDKLIVSPFSNSAYVEEVTALLKKYNLLNKLTNSTLSRSPTF